MRDLVVREALRAMSRDAAKRLRELVAAGDEIPYEVREPGNGSPLCQYAPLTERFIREHVGALRDLDSFGAACAAIESADLAGPYLEELGVKVPPDPRRRAELAGIAFLCSLWWDSTDFPLASDRLAAAIAELQSGGEGTDDEIEVAVPLRGFQMPVTRLELATATIVRADTVEVPPDARAGEGNGAAWEPTFLAVARVEVGDRDDGGDDQPRPDAGTRAVTAFTRLITSLRLFKPGGVGLGAHAWTRVGPGDRWRRIATGAGRPRPGGYRLAESELAELTSFSHALEVRGPAASEPLARAVSRFEAGLERHVVLEALNDYLLALRFLLEGGGPADLGLAMRIAALCAEPERRGEVKAVVDRALALERELWSGEPAPDEGAQTPAEVAAEIEDLTRAILKDASVGHLGGDLRAAADEILLADGLAVGEGAAEQRGETAEWDDLDEELEEEPVDAELEERPLGAELEEHEVWLDGVAADSGPVEDYPQPMQVPEPPGRITVEESREPKEEQVIARTPQRHYDFSEPSEDEADESRSIARREPDDSSVAGMLQHRPAERRAIADRVAYLFPRPETTEWDISELRHKRRRARAEAS